MADTKITIYVDWMNLIKQEEYPDWTIKYFAKQLWDSDVWEEIMYGWTNVEASSVDEVKDLLSSK